MQTSPKVSNPSQQQDSEQLSFFDPLLVELTIFKGPLQLLLDLIRKKKMDIKTVPLAEICGPYLEYVNRMEELNFNSCGEFLVISATLILIKSKTLLPKVEEEPEDDPEELLRSRLIEFEQLKNVTSYLINRDIVNRDVFVRPLIEDEDTPSKLEEEFDITLYQLINAFKKVSKKLTKRENFKLESEVYKIEERIVQMVDQISSLKECYLEDFFEGTNNTPAFLVITFLSLLEMIHKKIVVTSQEVEFGKIRCIFVDSDTQKVLQNFIA